MFKQKIKEFTDSINSIGNSYLDRLKEDNFSIKSKNLTTFGPKTYKWGKMFIHSTKIELVIDMPLNVYTEESIANQLELNHVKPNSKITGFRIHKQKDREQLIINIYETDFSKISLANHKFKSFLFDNSKLVCR